MAKTTRSALGLSAVALCAFVLTSCGGHGDDEKGGPQPAGGSRQTVTAATVAQGSLDRTITASGTVSAWEEVPIGAETGGLVATAVYVDEGAYVRQGQPLVQMNDATRADAPSAFKRLVGRVGEPVIRLAVRQAMKIMGHQFVMGRTIGEALTRSRKGANAAYRYSFDMLGEAALTQADADRYLKAYRDAIDAIGRTGPFDDAITAPSISVKLLQEMAGAMVIGPILTGVPKPIQILSTSSTVNDILHMAAIAAGGLSVR